jgi:geranylgeranyl diphosphate synthase, type I
MATERPTEKPRAKSLPPLKLVEEGVSDFATRLRTDMINSHPYVQQTIESYLSVLEAGGKRIRGTLAICGYEMHGGKDKKIATLTAGAIEGLHAYLLVIDDIADKALTRRGKPAAHVAMESFLRKKNASGNIKRTAIDMVISGALTAQHKAQVVLANLDAPAKRKLHAVTIINEHLERTGLGQILDMASTTGMPMDIRSITSVALSKTAYYSFQMPLETGAILAGATEPSLRHLKAYSQHAGLAFQLQDDVMGVFGDERKMGKSAKSDIIEGKQTLLLAYALEAATPAQQDVLRHGLGNVDLTDELFARCQDIIVETGALIKVSNHAKEQVALAHTVLDNAPSEWPTKNIDYLRTLASFAADRDT